MDPGSSELAPVPVGDGEGMASADVSDDGGVSIEAVGETGAGVPTLVPEGNGGVMVAETAMDASEPARLETGPPGKV